MKSLKRLAMSFGPAIIGRIVKLVGQFTVIHLLGDSLMFFSISVHLCTLGGIYVACFEMNFFAIPLFVC